VIKYSGLPVGYNYYVTVSASGYESGYAARSILFPGDYGASLCLSSAGITTPTTTTTPTTMITNQYGNETFVPISQTLSIDDKNKMVLGWMAVVVPNLGIIFLLLLFVAAFLTVAKR
jgi:hypothetical protein